MSSTNRRVLTGIGFVLAVTVTATGIDLIRDGHAQPVPETDTPQVTQTANRQPVVPTDPNVVQALSAAYRNATQSTLPAVVSIEVEALRQTSGQSPFGLPFRIEEPRQPTPTRGYGTGFVFRSDGYIMTNNHVVEDAERVTVRFQDRTEAQATVIGRDPDTDVAVVKVDRTGLETVTLGDSDQTQVGDLVVALGFPLNLQGTATVTSGIVSAMGRSLNILQQNGDTRAPLEHFIQTDAAINPGNSGGPLIDLNSNVIGINSAIASPTGYFSGYGFAIPINIARSVAEDLIRYGEVRRPQLGVGVRDVRDVDREAFNLPDLGGAFVSQVTDGKPAERAGIQLGDVIVSVDGTRIQDSGQLIEMLNNQYDPGDRIALEVNRRGTMRTFNVTLDSFEPAITAGSRPEQPRERGVARLGFRATDITPQIARQLDLIDASGVVVTEVDPRGSALGSVIRGTVIQEINGQRIENIGDLEEAAAGLDAGEIVTMIVIQPETGGQRTIVNYRLRE
jgi:serine protease Do